MYTESMLIAKPSLKSILIFNKNYNNTHFDAPLCRTSFGAYRIPDFILELPTQVDSVVLKDGREFSRDQVINAMKCLKALDEDKSHDCIRASLCIS